MTLIPPKEGWVWQKVATDEKGWVAVATFVCFFLFFWMIGWHSFGRQNPSNITYRASVPEYLELYNAYLENNQVGEDNGLPVVAPEPGSHVFFTARMWQWAPVVLLKKGETYTFHLYSLDLLHGFSLQPVNMNFMVYPGYDYVLRFTPTEAGEYKIVCNEFCGIGHHMMIGKIIVADSDQEYQKILQAYESEYFEDEGDEVVEQEGEE